MRLIDGKKEANKILFELRKEIFKLDKKPTLVAIYSGNNKSTKIYLRIKEKRCKDIGIIFKRYKINENRSDLDIIKLIEELNYNNSINGIMVQLPLPKKFNTQKILESIDHHKDVDCLCSHNLGKVLKDVDGIRPATPEGIIVILKRYNIELKGKKVVIINHSNILGKPLALMLLNERATVTICHEHTKNLEEETISADIIIVGVGKEDLIREDMVKKDAIIIDVGVVRTKDGIKGDVDFEKVKNKVMMISPVPGGVGPMTVAMLLKNTLICYNNQNKKKR